MDDNKKQKKNMDNNKKQKQQNKLHPKKTKRNFGSKAQRVSILLSFSGGQVDHLRRKQFQKTGKKKDMEKNET